MNAIALGNAVMGWVVWNSAGAAVVILLVLVAQYLLGSKISPRWRYNLWLLVIVRLILPTAPTIHVAMPHWARTFSPEAPSPMSVSAAVKPFDLDKTVTSTNPLSVHEDRAGDEIVTAPVQMQSNYVAPQHITIYSTAVVPASIAVDPDTSTTSASPTAPAATVPSAQRRQIAWLTLLEWFWLAGTVIGLARVIWSCVALGRATRELALIADPLVQQLLDDCCQLMHVRRVPRLQVAPANSGPALIGIWRPKLLLPVCVIENFDCRELRQILLHELAHLKRGDVAMNYLLAVLHAIHWFNPLIWLAAARIRAERELACDEAVLRLTPLRECRAYGCTMLKLLEALCHRQLPAGALGVVQHKKLMHRRILMIAQFDPRKRNWSATGALLSLLLIGAAVASAVRAQAVPAANPAQNQNDNQQVNRARAAVDAAAGAAPQNIAPPAVEVSAPTAPLYPSAPAQNIPGVTPPSAQASPQPTPTSSAGSVQTGGPMPNPAWKPGMPGAVPSLTQAPAAPDAIRTVEDPAAVQANAKTAEKLKKPVSAQFNGVALRDVLSFFADTGGIDIVLDEKSLSNELGAEFTTTPVTMVTREPRPLDQLLPLALRVASAQIDYSLVNGVVFVSSRSELSRHVITRVYDIGNADPGEMSNLIINTISPSIGVSFVGSKLVVTAPEPRQRDISKLLAMLGSNQRQIGQPIGRDAQSDTTVYPLKHARALTLAPLLNSSSPNLKALADDRTNSLIVTGSPNEQRLATNMLQKLDQPGTEEAKAAPDDLMKIATDILAKMRSLSEDATVASQKYAPSHPRVKAIENQLNVLGKELEKVASELEKEGRQADLEKLHAQVNHMKALLTPLRIAPEATSPPAAR